MSPTFKPTSVGFFISLNPPDFALSYPTHPLYICPHRYGEPPALRYARHHRQATDVLTPDMLGMIPISTLFTLSGESAIADQSALARGTPLDPRSHRSKSRVPRLKPPALWFFASKDANS